MKDVLQRKKTPSIFPKVLVMHLKKDERGNMNEKKVLNNKSCDATLHTVDETSKTFLKTFVDSLQK